MQDRLRKQTEQLAKGSDSERQDVSDHWGEDVRRLYQDRGIGTSVGFGNRPALLVIDMSIGFNDPSYRVGADQTAAVRHIATLLRSARECQVPIYFFTTAYQRDGRDGGMFTKKIPALLDLQAGDRAVEIDPRLAPIDDEIVITKKFSSAFFETNLVSLLVGAGIDTVILTGCSTSGCVRAAAVDGVSYGYRVIVPEECVSDRADGPHYANLFDINAKYGDVLSMAEVLEYFDTLPKDPAARHGSSATR